MLIDSAPSLATKRQMRVSRVRWTPSEGMTGVSPFTEPVDPVIANADTSRGQGVISRERLIRARIIVAPLKHYVPLGIKDFATPLRIPA